MKPHALLPHKKEIYFTKAAIYCLILGITIPVTHPLRGQGPHPSLKYKMSLQVHQVDGNN
jgi:hypothetical protein